MGHEVVYIYQQQKVKERVTGSHNKRVEQGGNYAGVHQISSLPSALPLAFSRAVSMASS